MPKIPKGKIRPYPREKPISKLTINKTEKGTPNLDSTQVCMKKP